MTDDIVLQDLPEGGVAHFAWGDQTGTDVDVDDQGEAHASHTYATPGAKRIDVDVFDDEGDHYGHGHATFTAVAVPTPTVGMVAPSTGSVDGGEQVQVAGSGYVDGGVQDLEVAFGAELADVQSVNGGRTMVTVLTPPGAEGVVDVVVTNGWGRASTPGASSRFTYVADAPLAPATWDDATAPWDATSHTWEGTPTARLAPKGER